MIDFLESLSIKEKASIYKNIKKLVEYKNNNFNLSYKFTKPLRDGIFELKVDLQNTSYIKLLLYHEVNITKKLGKCKARCFCQFSKC